MMKLKTSALLLLLSLVPSWATFTVQAAPAKSKPNFVVLLCDDLGGGDLSCFAHPTIKTPHLDQFELYNVADDLGEAKNLAAEQPGASNKWPP